MSSAARKPASPLKGTALVLVLLILVLSAWKMLLSHTSLTRRLALMESTHARAHAQCAPCVAAPAAAAALQLPCMDPRNNGSGGGNGSSSFKAGAGLDDAQVYRNNWAAGGPGAGGGIAGAGVLHIHDAPVDSVGRDWVFRGGVGAEESGAHMNAILDTEASRRDLTPECKRFGGSEVVTKLQQGGLHLCAGSSSIKVYSSLLPNKERPMHVAVLQNASFGPQGFRVTCTPTDGLLSNRTAFVHPGDKFVSTKLLQTIQLQQPNQSCPNPSGVLLLVSANDYWNWWWFLVQLQNAFVALSAVQPDVDPGPRTVMFLEKDGREEQDTYGRIARRPLPFRELYLHLFASRYTPDVRWEINPSAAYGCYRSVVFLRNAESGSPILKNVKHPWSTCFSPVITALVAYIKASVNLPTIAPPAIPTVCWMSRDENVRPEFTTWQKMRTIKDQAGLVSKLNELASDKGVRVIQLAFYANHSSTAIAEQLHRTARCSLVTGMHGAGLYAAVAMDQPAILELSTQLIPNRNAPNLMSHIGGCYQGMEVVKKDKVNSTLDPLQVWPKVLSALQKCGIVG